MGRHRSLYLFLYCRHIEGGALLHGRELDEGLRLLSYFLLHKHKTPELECKPVVVGDYPAAATKVGKLASSILTGLDQGLIYAAATAI
jgi:hypothetical protein